MVCTGGPAPLKHDRECQCSSAPTFSLNRARGHYTCREEGFKGRNWHIPLLRAHLARDDKWFVHKPCACNHMNALRGRVGKCTPPTNPDSVKTLLNPLVDHLAKHVGRYSQCPYPEVYRAMNAKKRARYQRAEEVLISRGRRARKRDARITMFVKIEGIKFSEAKENPDCRAIQFRSPEYTLQLASHIKRAEHALYKASDVDGFGSGPIFAKNLNPSGRAKALRRKYMSIPGCHVLELDASRFDAHVSLSLLQLEHRFWRGTCLGEQLDELLKWQEVNKGEFITPQFRQKYTVVGSRMSGDANTAAGNCIIMGALLAAFGKFTGRKFTFLCDGDDSVFFHDGEPIPDEVVESFFRQFGMSMKIEARPECFEDINFCQAKPVEVNGEWTMIRNPRKIMSKIGVSPKLFNVRARPKYIRTVALGELSMTRGCPLLQKFLSRLIHICESKMSARQKKRGMIHRGAIGDVWRLTELVPKDWQVLRTEPVTPEARQSFSRAWGISVQEQLQLEELLDGWTIDLAKEMEVDGPDVPAWMWGWQRPEEW
jgi:hypothetical protein